MNLAAPIAYVAGSYLYNRVLNRYRTHPRMPYRRPSSVYANRSRVANPVRPMQGNLRGALGVGAYRRTGPYLRGNYMKKTVYNRGGVLGGTNADVRKVYRKKRMPRKKKRQWKTFVRKVNAISEKELGTRTVLFNDQIQQQWSNSAQQGCMTLALYTISNASLGFLNDLNQIGTFENTSNPTAAAGATVGASTKYMFQSAVMDLTIRNTSVRVLTLSPTYENDPNCSLELDVYELSFNEDAANSTAQFTSMAAVLNAYDTAQIGGTGSGISIEDRGATPWEVPVALGRFKVKIWKKTKYFIPAGQTITHQMRDPKRHVLRNGDLQTTDGNDGWNRPGLTKILFIIYKPVPGLTIGTAVGNSQPSITVGSTRKYMYKVEGINDDRERYITNSYSVANPI